MIQESSGFCHYTVTRRHTGELLGNPPIGNDIEFGGAVVVHYAGGKLIEEWEYVDRPVSSPSSRSHSSRRMRRRAPRSVPMSPRWRTDAGRSG